MQALFAAVGTGGGLSAIFGGSSAATAMQGGATLLSAISSLGAGRAKKRAARANAAEMFMAADFAREDASAAAADYDAEAKQAYTVGKFRAARLIEDTNDTIGNQRVAFAASGVSASDGTAARIQEQTARRGAEDAQMERDNAEIAASSSKLKANAVRRKGLFDERSYRMRGQQYLANGKAEQRASYLNAFESVLNFGADVAKRG